jgi:hypothetical protein
MHIFTFQLLLLLTSSLRTKASPIPEDLLHGTEIYPPEFLALVDQPGPPADFLLPPASNQPQTDWFLDPPSLQDQSNTSPDLFAPTIPVFTLGADAENDPNTLTLLSQEPEHSYLLNSHSHMIDDSIRGLGTFHGSNGDKLWADIDPQCTNAPFQPVHTCCHVVADPRPDGAVEITVNECKESKVSLSVFRPNAPLNLAGG